MGPQTLRPSLQPEPIMSEEAAAPPGAAVPVLMMNVGWHALHHGGLGIVRSLGRMGVPVYAVVVDRFTPAAVSRFLAGAFVWDARGLDARRFLEGMALIGRRLARPAVVIPTGDLSASLGYYRRGQLTFREWRRSLQGRRELAWLSRDDLLPFAALCGRLLRAAEKLRLEPPPRAGNDLPRYVRGRRRGAADVGCR